MSAPGEGVLLAALVAGLALWLLVPHPAAGLGRLRERDGSRRRGWAGRAGARPLRQRLLAGLGGGALVALLLPGTAGLLLGAVTGVGTALGLGLLPARPVTGALTAQLPEALEFLAVCLDAGQPVSRAVTAVASISPPQTRLLLEGVGAQLALGRAGPDAWQELRAHPVWGRVAADIARAEHSGTGLAAVLRLHAEEARAEAADAAVKAARRVGVRSVVPLMACFLPAFILVGVVPIIAGLLRDFFG